VLGFNNILEEGNVAVIEINYPVVFTINHQIYIADAVVTDCPSNPLYPNPLSSSFFRSKTPFCDPYLSASEQYLTAITSGHLFLPLYLLHRFRRSIKTPKSHNLLRHVSPSVCWQQTIQLPLQGI
jgi:hypothetical protein